ncbi:anaerobic ribonucleoside-triphosphate reductase activating protein [Desulfovibrio sp. OttesenSCG-928-O18]|nr:anaerobic ribonucleoside-triphosphate reductase activating protein [Desulfovibrio sp. OttesenSCG-928-O18]
MLFGGMQKLTTLDFPGVVSALFFTQGCNFHCPYCHNPQLIPMRPENAENAVSEADALSFLTKRRDVLDGVVISGGEPCLQPDLEAFCRTVKSLGYKIKLDTNGFFPGVVSALLTASLLDYVAVDVKTAPQDYAPALCRQSNAGESLAKTLDILAASAVRFEVRTTCVAPFVTADTVQTMAEIVDERVPWFFQRANLDDDAVAKGMRALSDDEIRGLLALVAPRKPLAAFR